MVAATATSGIPGSYDELALEYGPSIRAIVHRRVFGAQPADIDNITQYILLRLQAVDVIGQYDPDLVPDSGRKATFRTFLLSRVPVYCRGQGETLAKVAGRELLVGDQSSSGDGSPWIETVAGGNWDDYPSLSREDQHARLRSLLAARPAADGQPGLVDVFDAVAARVAEGRDVTPAALSRRLKVNPDEAAAYLLQLREELRSAVLRDYRGARVGCVQLAGQWLTPDQVRTHADVLEGRKGNQVLRVWKAAKLPLAAAGPTWYLVPAKAELEVYPELREEPVPLEVRPGRTRAHGGAVKRGLIHWLRRIADGDTTPDQVPERMPEPPPDLAGDDSAWTVLELAVTALGGATSDKIAAALAAVREVFGP